MVKVNLKRTFSLGEWEKGVTIKDNVEKVWAMCALLNIKLQQKRTKRKMIQTANISYSTL